MKNQAVGISVKFSFTNLLLLMAFASLFGASAVAATGGEIGTSIIFSLIGYIVLQVYVWRVARDMAIKMYKALKLYEKLGIIKTEVKTEEGSTEEPKEGVK